MSLIMNHNLLAENAMRNLGGSYKKLSSSIERLSTGLRINSATDDAAGLAIREMMRANIAAMQQGIRNATDAISLLQTADGAMAIIDEKLIRMKELATQAAGPLGDFERDIINSEYQAMAAEIDRIANATNFNGVKLLDGSMANQNGGQGMKIHFGAGNNAGEDYYFIKTGDVRATASTGLQIGGDGYNDIWAQGGAALAFGGTTGCCAGGYDSLNGASFRSGDVFSYGYNWDLQATSANGADLAGGKYTAGLWEMKNGASLADLIAQVNQGSQARVGVKLSASLSTSGLASAAVGICFGNEIYALGSASVVSGTGKEVHKISSANASALVSAINIHSKSFWAMYSSSDSTVYVFSKTGGAEGNSLVACEQAFPGTSGSAGATVSARGKISFLNVAAGAANQSGTSFSLGGEKWATLNASQTGTGNREIWNLVVNGRDIGQDRNLWIANITAGTGSSTLDRAGLTLFGKNIHNGRLLDRGSFAEVQNAGDPPWAGAEIRTQESAQKALEALDLAIQQKDKVRATLGAFQARLENTISTMEIQAENLQAAESRISDVDVAREVTELTKNSVLVQAATSMVAQANSMNRLALTLLGM